jgi:hypothetical protein
MNTEADAESRYQATSDEDSRLRRLSAAVVNCRVCELTMALKL